MTKEWEIFIQMAKDYSFATLMKQHYNCYLHAYGKVYPFKIAWVMPRRCNKDGEDDGQEHYELCGQPVFENGTTGTWFLRETETYYKFSFEPNFLAVNI